MDCIVGIKGIVVGLHSGRDRTCSWFERHEHTDRKLVRHLQAGRCQQVMRIQDGKCAHRWVSEVELTLLLLLLMLMMTAPDGATLVV